MTGGTWTLSASLNVTASQLFAAGAVTIPYTSQDSAAWTLTFGTGNGSANLVVSQLRSLLAGANETLNLNGGLNDIFGVAAAFRTLRAYAFRIASGGDTSGVTVGNAGANPHPLFHGS